MRSVHVLVFCVLPACGQTAEEEVQDAAVPDAKPPDPDAMPTPARIDGEYAVRVDVLSYRCYGEEQAYEDFADIISVVAQEEAGVADVLPQRFYDAAIYGLNRTHDGAIVHADELYFNFFGYLVVLKRTFNGRLTDDRLEFAVDMVLGAYEEDGVTFFTACEMSYEVAGTRRYESWSGRPRYGIDGQWLVTRTVLEDSWPMSGSAFLLTAWGERQLQLAMIDAQRSLNFQQTGERLRLGYRFEKILDIEEEYSAKWYVLAEASQDKSLAPPEQKIRYLLGSLPKFEDLDSGTARTAPYRFSEVMAKEPPRVIAIETRSQADDDSGFDLKGTDFGFANVLRSPDGAVDMWIYYPYGGHEWTVKGTVTEDALDLELMWRWFDPATGNDYHVLRVRYQGVPRFEPYDPSVPEPSVGAYLARYVLTEDTCEGGTYDYRRSVEVVPWDDGILVWATGYRREPPVRPGPGGSFSLSFARQWGYTYLYEIDGAIDGSAVGFDLDIEVVDSYQDGLHICDASYRADGFKRYRSHQPTR